MQDYSQLERFGVHYCHPTPIRGKVTAIDILSEEDAKTVLGTIDGERHVERFAELVLESPVDQEWWAIIQRRD